MTVSRKLSLLACAGLAMAALPALSAQTIYIETAPSDPVYPPSTTWYYDTAPATTIVYSEPAIIVTPPDDDASINQGVVDTLAMDPYLSGRIGVETDDRNVELSGIVTTEGQAMRAERDAQSVYGVRNVQDHLVPRVGPHTH